MISEDVSFKKDKSQASILINPTPPPAQSNRNINDYNQLSSNNMVQTAPAFVSFSGPSAPSQNVQILHHSGTGPSMLQTTPTVVTSERGTQLLNYSASDTFQISQQNMGKSSGAFGMINNNQQQQQQILAPYNQVMQ